MASSALSPEAASAPQPLSASEPKTTPSRMWPVSSRSRRRLLLGSVFIVAHCGLVYELVAGAVSSYLLGDAVTQFSLVIGAFLSAMGLGSYLAKFIQGDMLGWFVHIELWLGVAGGTSSLLMFAVSALAPSVFSPVFYLLCVLLGALVGLELPLLVRLLRESDDVRSAVSDVLSLDYFGALVASILFPFVVLPYIGLSRASVVFGLMNLAVAALGIRLLPPPRRYLLTQLALATTLLVAAFVFSSSLVGFFEDELYQDRIVFARSTKYQRIVLTRWRDDLRLYLDGHVQFSSVDEARYHEALVIPAMESHPNPRRVLVLGGGDGLATREILKYPSVQSITLVDLDPVMTDLGRNRADLVALNQRSLHSPKVQIHNDDAMRFAREDTSFYDVIIVDLPDPHAPALAKLYSRSFYALLAHRLSSHGVLVTQATSPFFAPEAFWCIVETLRASRAEQPEGGALRPIPYHVDVPSFGEWGFVLAARAPIHVHDLTPSVPTHYLTKGALQAMFSFGDDLREPDRIEVNRLEHPVLTVYYERGWEHYDL